MTISNIIIKSYLEGFSGVYIYCPKEKMDEVALVFERIFREAWNKALDEAEKEYAYLAEFHEDEEDYSLVSGCFPASVKKEDARIYIDLNPLYVTINDGVIVENGYGEHALKDSLSSLKKKYPEISYEGIVAYFWSDESCGDCENYEISSDKNIDYSSKTYDFVGEKLRNVIESKWTRKEFWERMRESMVAEEDFNEVVTDFHAYGLDDYIDQVLNIDDVIDEIDKIDDKIRGTRRDFHLELTLIAEQADIKKMIEIFAHYRENGDRDAYFDWININGNLVESGVGLEKVTDELVAAFTVDGEVKIKARGPHGSYCELNDVGLFREMAESAPNAKFVAKISGLWFDGRLPGYLNFKCTLEGGKLRITSFFERDADEAWEKDFMEKLPYKKFKKLFEISGEGFDIEDYKNFVSWNFDDFFCDAYEFDDFVSEIEEYDAEIELDEDRYKEIFEKKLPALGLISRDKFEVEFDGVEINEYVYDPIEKTYEGKAKGNYSLKKLAMAYLNGDDVVDEDPEKAYYWFVKLAEIGDDPAMFNVGLFTAKGFGTERDFAKTAEWMQKAADEGDEDAEGYAAEFRKLAETVDKAKAGDAQAQADLACRLMKLGGSIEQAYEESVLWAEKAVAQDNPDGYWALGLAYHHGRGVDEDMDKAIELYRKGADAGSPACQHNLGCEYMSGINVKKDTHKAFELIKAAAEQGYGLAMRDLGRCYQFANGTPGNMKTAMEWYEKALEVIDDPELAEKTAFFKMMADADPSFGEDYPEDEDE